MEIIKIIIIFNYFVGRDFLGIGSSPFYLIKLILSISNERPEFKVDTFNDVYEVNVDLFFKSLNKSNHVHHQMHQL
jgi:hypothetical protein